MFVPLSLHTELLMHAEAYVDTPLEVGNRRIAYVTGGAFEGPKLKGKILPGGGDWITARQDGSMALDIRACMETDDGALIYTAYPGRVVISPELMAEAEDRAGLAGIDPSRYYFRTLPTYETGAEKYAWLNNIVAVGVGRLTERGVAYSVYEVT